jgi:hypothetical protein
MQNCATEATLAPALQDSEMSCCGSFSSNVKPSLRFFSGKMGNKTWMPGEVYVKHLSQSENKMIHYICECKN